VQRSGDFWVVAVCRGARGDGPKLQNLTILCPLQQMQSGRTHGALQASSALRTVLATSGHVSLPQARLPGWASRLTLCVGAALEQVLDRGAAAQPRGQVQQAVAMRAVPQAGAQTAGRQESKTAAVS
jgi:hypothetical protein